MSSCHLWQEDSDYMKKLLLYFILLLFGLNGALSAQNVPNHVKRKMNLAVLDMLEKMEKVSTFSSPSDAAEFVAMFRDPDSQICNDLIGLHDGPTISPADYASALGRMNDVSVVFTDVEKSLPYIHAGSLCVKVSMGKTLSYRGGRNVLYSSEDMYGGPYRLHVVFSYDDFDGTCLVESVETEMEPALAIGKDHLVYREQKGLEDLRFNGGYISYNSAGQALLPGSAAEEDWYYMQNMPDEWDPDVFISTHVTRDGFIKLGTYTSWIRVKAYNATAPAGAFAVEGDFDAKWSIANETGAEVRFMPGIGRAINMGVYAGMGVSYSHLNLSLADFQYSYLLGGLQRKYEFNLAGQRFNTVDAVLAGGLAVEYAFAPRWTLEFQAGAKAYYNLLADAGDVYCDYVVTYGSEEAIHKVGHFKAESIEGSKEFTPDVWPCPLSVTGALGFSYNLNKRTLFSFGLEYEHGLNCYYQSEGKSYREGLVPVAYSSAHKADVAKKSMTDSFILTRRAVWLDLGVTFKF